MSAHQMLAATPPRGWNSYDSYTWKVSEHAFLDNCAAMAKTFKSTGYEYCIVDYLWFQNLEGDAQKIDGLRDPINKMHIDKFGRLQPAPDRWPSAWAPDGTPLGFKAVADKVHAMGMKFGIHIMRGISTTAVAAKSPVLGGAGATADQIGVPSELCPWWKGVMSVNCSHPAGRAFFDSITAQYADWGVDFLKNDCVFGDQYAPTQIVAQSAAIRASGRPMVYSLSPGGTAIGASGAEVKIAREIAPLVNMYRVTGDDWDSWGAIDSHFAVADSFASAGLIGVPGLSGHSWPDLDMLPLGWITSPGSGRLPYKKTSLTHSEQRAQMSLWAIAKSPLMFGGDATHLDPWTISVLSNPAVLSMNAHAVASHQVRFDSASAVWAARHPTSGVTYAALFNRRNATAEVSTSCASLGLNCTATVYEATDLWESARPTMAVSGGEVRMRVEPHGVALLGLAPHP